MHTVTSRPAGTESPAASPAVSPAGSHPGGRPVDGRRWTFLTNHAHVLLVVRHNPTVLLRELAEQVGITPRAAQLILADLERTGYLQRARHGRRNTYTVLGGPLRHPLEAGRAVEDLLTALTTPPHTSTPGTLSSAAGNDQRPRRGGRPTS